MLEVTDDGLISTLAKWMVNQLAALQHENKTVFASVELYRHQIGPTESGLEKIEKSPIAYIDYMDDSAAREGGYSLREVPEIDILIIVKSKENGVAKWGDATHLGISKIRDLIITLFDKKRPDDIEIDCDEFYYTGSVLTISMPKLAGIQMRYEVSRLNN